jgi:proteasome assembly chaperone (PAC2) family protein
MDKDNIVWHEKPGLVKPHMVLAFSGWTNAAQAASATGWYLIRKLKATLFAEVKPDDFYVYQASGTDQKRPLVNIENGIIQSLNIVTTNFSYYRDVNGGHDLIIASGPEPEQKWIRYSDLLLDLAREYQVEKMVAIGGSFEAIPHTAPVRITGVVNQANLIDEMKGQGIEPISYKGPSSFYTLFMLEAAKRGLPVISLWASTPHYIQVINFIAVYNLLMKLTRLLDIKIDLEEARRDSEYLVTQIDQAIAQKPDLQEHLKMLEKEYLKGKPQPRKAINQNIVREIEDLLRDNQGRDSPGGAL